MLIRNLNFVSYNFCRKYYNHLRTTKQTKILPLPHKIELLSYIWIPTFFTVHAFEAFKENNGPNLFLLDKLFEESKFYEIKQQLSPYKDTGNFEILWRLARAIYKLAAKITDEKQRRELIFEGMAYAEKALELEPNSSAVHIWYCALLDSRDQIIGIKARINAAERLKYHMMKAVELAPEDALPLHMLASWCYEVTALPWYQRKIASSIFGSLPTSSYEEALEFCLQAEHVSPNQTPNLILMGKIYNKLDQREKAIEVLKRLKDFPAVKEEDVEAKREATKMLRDWGVKN